MFDVASFLRSNAGRRLAGVLGAAALLLVLAPASAAATVTRGTITTTSSESGLPDDCRPGITGTIVATDVLMFEEVDKSIGFQFVATDTANGQITWTDGTYTIIESVDHIAFVTGAGSTTLTIAHEDSGNTYTAGGVFLSRTTFHNIDHFTRTDGVLRVNFERGHFHFFEGC